MEKFNFTSKANKGSRINLKAIPTQFQQEVLRWMRDEAIQFVGKWIEPSDIRHNRHLAEEVYWHLMT